MVFIHNFLLKVLVPGTLSIFQHNTGIEIYIWFAIKTTSSYIYMNGCLHSFEYQPLIPMILL